MPIGEAVLFRRRVDRPVAPAAERACRPSPASAPGRSGGRRRAARSRPRRDPDCACGTRIEARSRGSRSSNSFAVQSLTAAHSAAAMSSLNSAIAPCSTLQMAKRVPNGIERLAPERVEIAAGQSRSPAASPAGAERRIRRIARQRERVAVDVAVDELVAPVIVEIGQQRRGGGHRGMDVAIDGAVRNLHGPVMGICIRAVNSLPSCAGRGRARIANMGKKRVEWKDLPPGTGLNEGYALAVFGRGISQLDRPYLYSRQ